MKVMDQNCHKSLVLIYVAGQNLHKMKSDLKPQSAVVITNKQTHKHTHTHTHTYIYIYIYIYTGCNRRNMRDFGRVFLRSNYTDITQNTYIQS